MNMIKRMADRLVDLAVPRVTASASQRWVEYRCTYRACTQDPYRQMQRESRWCSESWCEPYRDNGCC